jgi:hypothetical protein
MNEHDRLLFEEIIQNKQRYSIEVDNDCVIVIDKTKNEDDESFAVTFSEYGYHLLVELFQFLGFDADYV